MPVEEEPVTVGMIDRLRIECADCGRSRWREPSELVKKGISLHVEIRSLLPKFSCSECADDGLPARNITVQALFLHDHEARRAERDVLRSQEALSKGSLAKGF